jgi:hypothetical protein
MREQADLREDIAALQRWAKGNRHLAAGVWFHNGRVDSGPTRIGVGVVCDGIESLAAELRGLISNPEKLCRTDAIHGVPSASDPGPDHG